jgi:diguanylate cyclase (GGDEF)-like protein/PAS domain S-box-containing protein
MSSSRTDSLDLLAKLTANFASLQPQELDAAIDRTMSAIGLHFSVDRSYLFRLSVDGSQMSNTHEWCAPTIKPQIAELQNIDVEGVTWWMNEMRSGRNINLHSLADLPEDAVQERAILEPQGIQSLLVLPIMWHGRLEGFVGFDHVRGMRAWGTREIHVLRVIATTFAQAFERERVGQRLDLAATVFQNAHDGIFVTDRDERIIEINPTFSEVTGFSREEVIGRTPNLLSSGRHSPAFYRAMWASIHSTGHWRGEVWNKRKDGTHFLQRLAVSSVLGPTGEVERYVGVFSDVTLQHLQAQQLEQLAFYDSLTRLPNRALCAERLTHALKGPPLMQGFIAICSIDLDGFKMVNDKHGKQAGDQVLIEIGRRIQGTIRTGDTVARLGGDEYWVLLEDIASSAHAIESVERILRALAEPLALTTSDTVTITGSIGVRIVGPSEADMGADALLRQADQAMYRAKQEGRSRFHTFDAAQDLALMARHEHINHVQLAILRGEMRVYVQPIIGLNDGQIRFVEALVRWQKPEGTVSAPAEWLPGIEETPIIAELGSWMLEQSIQRCAEWAAKGVCNGVSINVSAYELRDSEFPNRLRKLLSRFPSLNPTHLKLEILESAALSDVEVVIETMSACRALGVSLAIDDFGTGYSSLAYLKRLPVQTLKIDRSFIADMLHDAGDHAIVKGIIELSKVFELESVAEGIESAAHLTALEALGCDAGQGYQIARPMPAEDFEAWVADRSSKQSR